MQIRREIALGAGGAHIAADLDAGIAQPRQPPPGDPFVGIDDRDDDACDAGLDQRFGTRRRVPVVVTGLERAVRGCAERPGAGLSQGCDLRVRPGGERSGRAFPDDLALARQDTADGGPRRGMATRGPGDFDRPAHQLVVAHVPFPVRARGTCWRR
jgi:hypothetical protein